MATDIKLNSEKNEVTEDIFSGLKQIAEPVLTTMGPGGKNVLLEQQAGQPLVTKDGVTVANSIALKEPSQNLAAKILKEAADKTNREAGDGTTTSTAIGYNLYKLGMHSSKTTKISDLRMQIHRGKEKVLKKLEKYKKEVSGTEEEKLQTLEHIANISLNNDPEIAKMIAEATIKVGTDGVISVQDGVKNELERTEGMKFNTGYVSPHFIDNVRERTATLEDCKVLITSHQLKTVDQIREMEQLLNRLAEQKKPVLLISNGCSDMFLTNFISFNRNNTIKNCPIRPPYWGIVRKEFFTDLATLTGATVIEADEGMELKDVTLEHLGGADKIVVGDKETTIIGGKGNPDSIKERTETLRSILEEIKEEDKSDPDKIQERLAKLSGGVINLKLVRDSQVEGDERRDRVEDAVNSCRAALKDGYLPGGGAALFYAGLCLDEKIEGERILKKVTESPIDIMAKNANGLEGIIVRANLYNEYQEGRTLTSYDFLRDKLVDAYEAGIIDPYKVTTCAFKNGVSVATLLLTTDSIVTLIPEDAPQMPFQMM